jgi:hypothetical protein
MGLYWNIMEYQHIMWIYLDGGDWIMNGLCLSVGKNNPNYITPSFFRGVGQPPTRKCFFVKLKKKNIPKPDLPKPGIMVYFRECNASFMAEVFRLVKYYNLPRMMAFDRISCFCVCVFFLLSWIIWIIVD